MECAKLESGYRTHGSEFWKFAMMNYGVFLYKRFLQLLSSKFKFEVIMKNIYMKSYLT